MNRYDAIVIGSGPNGLAAAITLARAGRSVLVREGADTIGGSCRSAPLTLPGFTHDICSTVQAMAGISPFLQTIPLREHGCEFIRPPAAYAHPLDDGTAATVEGSVDETAARLETDGPAYRSLFEPLVKAWRELTPMLLGPPRFPAHPLRISRFGLRAIRSASALANAHFRTDEAKALFAGAAAHAVLPLEWRATAAFGLVLNIAAHVGGWPVAKGGSQKLADAMGSYLRSLGGEIQTGATVERLDELPPAGAILCDVTPGQLLRLAGDRLPNSYQRRLRRFSYGPGAFKIDWALNGPIPWQAAECGRAGTVHLGGALEEIAESERAPWQGRVSDRPYVLLVQSSLFDPTRAPPGKQTAWAYCHVPNGCTINMTERIENQVERFAPGFRGRILARHVMSPDDLQRHNPNLVGGDVGAGSQQLSQLFARPVLRLDPYSTPVPGLYLCSASTPPGGGVHGACGYFAAQSVLRQKAPKGRVGMSEKAINFSRVSPSVEVKPEKRVTVVVTRKSLSDQAPASRMRRSTSRAIS
jgi:phytoene dehydrogenase-like protein